eukprot:SAG22_NODE_28_length_28728_cov_19.603619_10_plen_77_part_00
MSLFFHCRSRLNAAACPCLRSHRSRDAYFDSAERFVGHDGPVIFVGYTPDFLLVTAGACRAVQCSRRPSVPLRLLL